MSGFPKLVPAFAAKLYITPPNAVGALATGGSLVQVGILPDQGYLRSEPGYEVRLDAAVVHGSDYIKADADGAHARLDVTSLLRDAPTGGLVRFLYTGTVDTGGAAGRLLGGEPGQGTTEFGEVFTHVVFETGAPELKALGGKTYVGSGRFVVEEGKPLSVEYKISEVVS